jgi:2-polyprenyl-3-methyl-5-hydroxy-6-metoxy-1,4-benzoquinol methylase
MQFMNGQQNTDIEMVVSPLTGRPNTQLIEQLSVEHLQKQWKRSFGIDIFAEYSTSETIALYECLDTRLRFFLPSTVAGSASFYAQLQAFDWYYMPNKWEHEVALQDITPGAHVLEVGCGFGDFVELLHQRKNALALGIELNAAAVRVAQEMGRRVKLASVEEVAAQEPESYDVVCHFEVLEHVVDPLAFLQNCLRCLKLGGLLIVAVPNMNSFIRHVEGHLLNQPPHHMTQWFPETFQSLTHILPVSIERAKFEPLAPYHVDYFINVYCSRFANTRYTIRKVLVLMLKKLVRPLLHKGLRRYMRGQTQYVVLYKQA